MKLIVIVGRDGLGEGQFPIPNNCAMIGMTRRARELFLGTMLKQNHVCRSCGIIARTDELGEDNLCVEGIGCGSDPDRETFFRPTSPEAGMAGQQIAIQILQGYKEHIARNVHNAQQDVMLKPGENPIW